MQTIFTFIFAAISWPRDRRQQQQQCTAHATTNWLHGCKVNAPSRSRQHHARVTDPRCTVSSCFVEPETRRPSHLLRVCLCWSYFLLQQVHVACMHVVAQPGTFEVETVVLRLVYGFKSSGLCFFPWQECGSRKQPMEAAVRTRIIPACCCRRRPPIASLTMLSPLWSSYLNNVKINIARMSIDSLMAKSLGSRISTIL